MAALLDDPEASLFDVADDITLSAGDREESGQRSGTSLVLSIASGLKG